MRVSTGMIFDLGVDSINRQMAALLHLQQQVSEGRRIISPSDDPVAAARALEVTQARSVVAQFDTNQNNAISLLGLEDAQLNGTTDVLARVRELAVQAGNTGLTASDRNSIAFELRARFDELVGIANATDGTGHYLFAGYMSAAKPFGGTVESILAGGEIAYAGDDGQRKLQVSPTRFLEVSDSGNDVFKRIRNGNGSFVTDYANANTGSAAIDAGSLTNPAAWKASATQDVSIRFTVTAGVTTYDLVDTSSGVSLLTGAAGPAPLVNQRIYQSGQPIVLQSQGAEAAFNLGASVTIQGSPDSGDSFTVAPSSAQSLFATVANLIGALEGAVPGSAGNAKLSNEVGFALTNLDQAIDNVLRVRAGIGSRLNEIDSLASVNQDLDLQYQQTLSQLQDLDYAKAISDLTRKQTDLQAAQQAFVRASQLSLFNYL